MESLEDTVQRTEWSLLHDCLPINPLSILRGDNQCYFSFFFRVKSIVFKGRRDSEILEASSRRINTYCHTVTQDSPLPQSLEKRQMVKLRSQKPFFRGLMPLFWFQVGDRDVLIPMLDSYTKNHVQHDRNQSRAAHWNLLDLWWKMIISQSFVSAEPKLMV